MSRNYVRNWITKQLLLYKAIENLSDEEKDIQKQVEDYQTTVLIYRYKQKLITQKLSEFHDVCLWGERSGIVAESSLYEPVLSAVIGRFAGDGHIVGMAFRHTGTRESLEAMQKGSKDRYFQDAEDDIKKLVPEGIVARVPFKGSLYEVIYVINGSQLGHTHTGNDTRCTDGTRTYTYFYGIGTCFRQGNGSFSSSDIPHNNLQFGVGASDFFQHVNYPPPKVRTCKKRQRYSSSTKLKNFPLSTKTTNS